MFVYHWPALCFKDLFLCWLYCSIASLVLLRCFCILIHWDRFYSSIISHQNCINIYHFELVYTTRTNVWNHFPLFRGCGPPPPGSHSVSTAIYQFHPEPNRDATSDNTPCWRWLLSPQIALVSPQCAELSVRTRRAFHLSAHVSIERESSSSDTLVHESFSFVFCTDN